MDLRFETFLIGFTVLPFPPPEIHLGLAKYNLTPLGVFLEAAGNPSFAATLVIVGKQVPRGLCVALRDFDQRGHVHLGVSRSHRPLVEKMFACETGTTLSSRRKAGSNQSPANFCLA